MALAMIDVIPAGVVGIYGILCGCAGYALGKRNGISEEFRDEQRTAEVLEFVMDDDELRP